MIQTLEDNHPARMRIEGDNNRDVSPTRAGIELGRTRGFSEAISMLRMMGDPIEPTTQDVGETTYEEPPRKGVTTNA